jgi:Transglycosylase SLT domain
MADLDSSNPFGDLVWGSQLQAESGNSQFDIHGNPIVSPTGAVGIAQIEPSTGPEAARDAGLPWDPERLAQDPQYNATLGYAYKNELLSKFKGDQAEATAAYNAGPGRVQQAEAEASSEGGDWTDYLPKETQQYLAKVLPGTYGGKFGKGGSQYGSLNAGQPGKGSGGIGGNAVADSSGGASDGSGGPSGMSPQAIKQLMLMSAIAPLYTFHPIDYDPFKVMPKEIPS